MRGAISESGGNASLAGERRGCWAPREYSGGQGVHREVESEGHEEKYRAVIDGGYLKDEPVGPRWGTVEPALWRRRRSHSPTTKVFPGGTVRKNNARPQEDWQSLGVAPE